MGTRYFIHTFNKISTGRIVWPNKFVNSVKQKSNPAGISTETISAVEFAALNESSMYKY